VRAELLNTSGLDELVRLSERGCTIHGMTEPRDLAPAERAPDAPTFSASELPQSGWRTFKKIAVTRAMRIEGPFRVETSESESEPFFCEDGWLAVDARGYPYAIAADEFAQVYAEVPPAAENAAQVHERVIRVGQGASAAELDAELLSLRGNLLEALGLEDRGAQFVVPDAG
jgi:hypothetical protein